MTFTESNSAQQDPAFLRGQLTGFVKTEPRNALKAHGRMRMYDSPLMAVAAADDPLFTEYRKPEIIGPHFLTPCEWLPGARSVIAYFLPFTLAVRDSNRRPGMPSEEWLSARIDGEAFNDLLRTFLIGLLKGMGGEAMAPVIDSRFRILPAATNPLRISCPGEAHRAAVRDGSDPPLLSRARCLALGAGQSTNEGLTSNWSERHAAFAAGLGTFGLHKALITEKGCAGRYGSVVTTIPLTVTTRPYKHPNEYCPYLMNGGCGACITRCPSGAIQKDGKKKEVCNAYIESRVHSLYVTHWGCAKCSVNVPCETGIPPGEREPAV